MTTEKRQITNEEIKGLRKEIRTVTSDINAPLKWPWIVVFAFLTVLSVLHMYFFDASNWSLISKVLVCFSPICIWIIIESKYKGRKKKQEYLNDLQTLADNGSIEVIRINAKRVIVFKEKEDEGTLYLIEDVSGKSIYLWDDQWLIPNKLKFPKATIEIYLDRSLIWALSSKVYCKGEDIEIVKVAGDKKWKFFSDIGFPRDLDRPEKSFDTILTEVKEAV